MSQFNPLYTLTFHFLKTYLNIILQFTPRTTQWSLSLPFPHQNPVHASPFHHTRYMPRPYHSYRFYNRTILDEENRSLSSSLCSLLHSPVTASSLAQIFYSTPYSQTPSAYVPPSKWSCVPFKNCCVITRSNGRSTWTSVAKCKAITKSGD